MGGVKVTPHRWTTQCVFFRAAGSSCPVLPNLLPSFRKQKFYKCLCLLFVWSPPQKLYRVGRYTAAAFGRYIDDPLSLIVGLHRCKLCFAQSVKINSHTGGGVARGYFPGDFARTFGNAPGVAHQTADQIESIEPAISNALFGGNGFCHTLLQYDLKTFVDRAGLGGVGYGKFVEIFYVGQIFPAYRRRTQLALPVRIVANAESGKTYSVIAALGVVNIFTTPPFRHDLRLEPIGVSGFDPGIHGITFTGLIAVVVSAAAEKYIYINRYIRSQKNRSGFCRLAGFAAGIGLDAVVAESRGDLGVPRQIIFFAIVAERRFVTVIYVADDIGRAAGAPPVDKDIFAIFFSIVPLECPLKFVLDGFGVGRNDDDCIAFAGWGSCNRRFFPQQCR